MVLAKRLFRLGHEESVVAGFAAMPSGINSYILARQYKAGQTIASSAVALSTGLAPLSAALWLLALQIDMH
ncbi:MAG: AEC family transporter [Methylovirgula sp.]